MPSCIDSPSPTSAPELARSRTTFQCLPLGYTRSPRHREKEQLPAPDSLAIPKPRAGGSHPHPCPSRSCSATRRRTENSGQLRGPCTEPACVPGRREGRAYEQLMRTGHLLGDRAVHLSNAPLLCGLRLAPGCAWYGSRRPSSYRLATTMPLAGGFCAFLAGRTGQSILGLDVTDRNANASVQTRSPVPPRQLGATESSGVHGRRSKPCRPVSADCTHTPKTPWRRPPGAQHFPSFGYDSQCRLWTDDETKTPEQPSGVGSAE